MNYLIHNATIVNEGICFRGSVLIENSRITSVFKNTTLIPNDLFTSCIVIDANGKYLIPGAIDDHVHFREPGFTTKADIFSESIAAVAGGVTSFMEMPNTNPKATTIDLINNKMALAQEKSLCNFSFYLGATNNNLDEILKADIKSVCGIKLFMGSSTGNMLVDNSMVLHEIFNRCNLLIAIHSEDEGIIRDNLAHYQKLYGDDIPVSYHPIIRNEEACYQSTSKAIEMAEKTNGRLHFLHISTAKELTLFNPGKTATKRITAEVCPQYLVLDSSFYDKFGTKMKINPAIKDAYNKVKLLEYLNKDVIDVIGTDHAPHLLEEKQNNYIKAPSGMPMVQHGLLLMLDLVSKGLISIEKVVEKTSHNVADLFRIIHRGYIREGYYADLVLIDMNKPYEINKSNLFYKCGWSVFEGTTLNNTITHTFVNGNLVFENGFVNNQEKGLSLAFQH